MLVKESAKGLREPDHLVKSLVMKALVIIRKIEIKSYQQLLLFLYLLAGD